MSFHIFRSLQLRPFSTESEEGRAAERYRRALWAMLANALSRVFGMALILLSIRWTMPYLGSERFGAWMTVVSLTVLQGILDLGVGNALTSRVAHMAAVGAKAEQQAVISGGMGLLVLIAIALMLILPPIAWFLPWQAVLDLPSMELADEVRVTAVVFGFLFALGILSNGVAKIFLGLQRGFIVHCAAAMGAALGIVALLWATHARAGLPVLLFCTMAGGLLSNLVLLIVLYAQGYVARRGIRRAIRVEAGSVLRVGSMFVLLQIGAIAGWGMDAMIIANAWGVASVAIFSVAQRFMQLVSQPIAVMNAPLWAAYANASAMGDGAFVRRTFKRSMLLTAVLVSLGGGLMFLFGPLLIAWWTKGGVDVNRFLLGALALWLVLEALGNALSMLLNGLSMVRQQVWVVFAFIVLSVPLKLWWVGYGAAGVVVACVVAYVLAVGVGYGVVFRRQILRSLQ